MPGTAAIQPVVIVLSGSVAPLGDTLHNVADALTAVPLLIAFGLSRRPATKRFTYGNGRGEDLGKLSVIAMSTVSLPARPSETRPLNSLVSLAPRDPEDVVLTRRLPCHRSPVAVPAARSECGT
jgi:hypothetical protein